MPDNPGDPGDIPPERVPEPAPSGAPPPENPWEVAARTMIRSRAEKLPPAFQDLLAAFPGSAGPDALIRFLEQAEAAAEGARTRTAENGLAPPLSPPPAAPPLAALPPSPATPATPGPAPKATDSRRRAEGPPEGADGRLWAELMNDGRKALDLKRRRPDLYESLRRRHAGRSPSNRKD